MCEMKESPQRFHIYKLSVFTVTQVELRIIELVVLLPISPPRTKVQVLESEFYSIL